MSSCLASRRKKASAVETVHGLQVATSTPHFQFHDAQNLLKPALLIGSTAQRWASRPGLIHCSVYEIRDLKTLPPFGGSRRRKHIDYHALQEQNFFGEPSQGREAWHAIFSLQQIFWVEVGRSCDSLGQRQSRHNLCLLLLEPRRAACSTF